MPQPYYSEMHGKGYGTMKKKWFSGGIYAEGMRQLRIFGFIVLSLYLVFLIAAPILEYISFLQMDRYSGSGQYPMAISFNSLMVPLMALPLFVAPIMTLIVFSGFNKRKYADFYHALPYTRICIFLSYTASILTWVFAVLILCGAVNLLMHLVFPTMYVVSFAGCADILLSMAVMALMTVTAVLLGCSFTGTLLANITASGLILFLPRFVIILLVNTITAKLPFIVEEHFMAILSTRYNILVDYLTSSVGLFGSSYTLQNNLSCDLYSLLVGLAMGVLAAILFVRRKSESAAQSAPRRSIQAGIRIALTLVFSFMATCMLLTGEGDLSLIVILYIFSILVYFIYELLSTHSWENLPKSIPALGIVLLLNLAFVGTVSGITNFSTSFRPKAEEISSVQFMTDDNSLLQYYNEESSTFWYDAVGKYAEWQVQNIYIDDPEIFSIVANILDENMERFHDRTSYNGNTQRVVAIKTGAVTRYRRIFLSRKTMDTLLEQLSQLPEYREGYLALPPVLSGTENVQLGSQGFIADKEGWNWDTILSCLQEEIREAGFETWYKYITNDLSYDALLSYTTESRAEGLMKVVVPLSHNLTPKTLSLLIEENYNSSGDAAKEAIQLLKGEIQIDDTVGYSTIIAEYSYVTESGQRKTKFIDFTNLQEFSNISKQQATQMMYQLGTQLENAEGTPSSERYVSIYYNYNSLINGKWKTGCSLVYFSLPDDFQTGKWNTFAYDS